MQAKVYEMPNICKYMLIYLHILTQSLMIFHLQNGDEIAKLLQTTDRLFLNSSASVVYTIITHAWKACIRQKLEPPIRF